jgi:hypothetical protein
MTLNLTAIAELRARLMAAQEGEARGILAVSNERIPVEAAVAQKSGRVVRDDATGTVWITYGLDNDGTATHAPSNQYIERIHEDVEMKHPHGGQSHFLSSAGDDATAGLAERIAMKARL